MYLFLILLFMFQLFIVKQRYALASHQVPENQKYSKITYMMLLEDTHVATNTVLKEDYTSKGLVSTSACNCHFPIHFDYIHIIQYSIVGIDTKS